MLLLIVAAAAAASGVCDDVDYDALEDARLRAGSPQLQLHAESLPSSRLFAKAREDVGLISVMPQHLVLVPTDTFVSIHADCVSGRVGIAFAEFAVGMDCSRARIDALQAQIEGMFGDPPGRVFGIRLEHLLRNLSSWRAERACDSHLPEALAALIFWVYFAACAFACCYVRTFCAHRASKQQ